MLMMLIEAALRSSFVIMAVWIGIRALRVRDPRVELSAWIPVLLAALAMPALMSWPVHDFTVPGWPLGATPPTGPEIHAALPVRPDVAPGDLREPAFPWGLAAVAAYVAITGALLLRLVSACVFSWRLLRNAQPYAPGIQLSTAIASPVTIGSTIVLPADFPHWHFMRQHAALLHEGAHAARGDFYVQLLAKLHQALFWFNPLSWWLTRRIAILAEAASDDAAIAGLGDRPAYAQVLLDLARGAPAAAVAMAMPSKLGQRIERILRDTGVPVNTRRWRRAAPAVFILPVAALAACGVDAAARSDATVDQALQPVAVAAAPTRPELLVPPAAPAPPVMPRSEPVPSARPVAPVAPVRPVPAVPATPAEAAEPEEEAEIETLADELDGLVDGLEADLEPQRAELERLGEEMAENGERIAADGERIAETFEPVREELELMAEELREKYGNAGGRLTPEVRRELSILRRELAATLSKDMLARHADLVRRAQELAAQHRKLTEELAPKRAEIQRHAQAVADQAREAVRKMQKRTRPAPEQNSEGGWRGWE